MAYKVLVVDDQAMPRQLFENMIKSAGGPNTDGRRYERCSFPGESKKNRC